MSERELALKEMMDGEASRLLGLLMPSNVLPWLERTAGEILAGRVLSAGPTRSGERVQVRVRLGTRLAASSHRLARLRDQDMDFFPPDVMVRTITTEFIECITKTQDIEHSLREVLRKDLSTFYHSLPEEVREGSSRSDPWRTAEEAVRGLDLKSRVISSSGVAEKIGSLIAGAAAAIALVPHQRFPDSGRKLEHENAKRKLLKAMKVAFLAGVTDAELEEIKNEALVNQVMS